MNPPIRVLVVDDSALMRHRLGAIFRSAPGYETIGAASSGQECLAMLDSLRPDAITMDVEMPGLSGIETLRLIMEQRPTPVIMVSSQTKSGASITLEALSLGAVEYLPKPLVPDRQALAAFAQELLHKVAIAAIVRMQLVARQSAGAAPVETGERQPEEAAAWAPARPPVSAPTGRSDGDPLVLIGSSTGGPHALDRVLTALERDLAASLLIVQHMPPVFTQSLAARLGRRSGFECREVEDGDQPRPGVILVAPGDRHAVMGADLKLHLEGTEPLHGIRPSIDRTLFSLAEHWSGPCLVVIMTGMGVDGTSGARAMRERDATIFAQDERTSIVYGMPRSVVEAGLASAVLPLDQMAGAISSWVRTAILTPAGRR
jgi:two-component system chemotaxis response regulator CheB